MGSRMTKRREISVPGRVQGSVNEPGACEDAGQWARVTRVREGALWKGTVSGGGREMGQVLSMDKGVWEKIM